MNSEKQTDDIPALQARIVEIDATIHPLNVERNALETKIAELRCPFKAGDLIEWRGRRGRVIKIFKKWGDWTLRVCRIRKDGSDGEVVEVGSYYNPKPYTPERTKALPQSA